MWAWRQRSNCTAGNGGKLTSLTEKGACYLHNSVQENPHDPKPQRKSSDSTNTVRLPTPISVPPLPLFKWPKVIISFTGHQAQCLCLQDKSKLSSFFKKIKILFWATSKSPIHKRIQTSGVSAALPMWREAQEGTEFSKHLSFWSSVDVRNSPPERSVLGVSCY